MLSNHKGAFRKYPGLSSNPRDPDLVGLIWDQGHWYTFKSSLGDSHAKLGLRSLVCILLQCWQWPKNQISDLSPSLPVEHEATSLHMSRDKSSKSWITINWNGLNTKSPCLYQAKVKICPNNSGFQTLSTR